MLQTYWWNEYTSNLSVMSGDKERGVRAHMLILSMCKTNSFLYSQSMWEIKNLFKARNKKVINSYYVAVILTER